MNRIAIHLSAAALAAFALSAQAQLGSKQTQSRAGGSLQQGQQQGQQRGQQGGRRGPPPQAIAACASKAAQASCSFAGRNGEAMSGVCMGPPPGAQAPKDAPLACRPDNAPPPDGGEGSEGGMQGPPPDQQ